MWRVISLGLKFEACYSFFGGLDRNNPQMSIPVQICAVILDIFYSLKRYQPSTTA